jgi:catechol 2,3-dioxygenase
MTDIPALRLAHMGMFVRDVDRMAAFYKEVLGFYETDRGETRERQVVFLTRNPAAHHQLMLSSGRPDSSGPTHAIQQISFMVDALDDLRAMLDIISARPDVTWYEQVDHDNAWSLYFRDPEDNRFEVYLDTPWYVAQPHRVDLDLSMTDAEIHRTTEARLKNDPTREPMDDWRRGQAEKLRAAGVRSGS